MFFLFEIKTINVLKFESREKVEEVDMIMRRAYNARYSTDGMIKVSIIRKVPFTCERQ